MYELIMVPSLKILHDCSLSNSKNTLAQMVSNLGKQIEWKLEFRRAFFVWEDDEVTRLRNLLKGVKIINSRKDVMVRCVDKKGKFGSSNATIG